MLTYFDPISGEEFPVQGHDASILGPASVPPYVTVFLDNARDDALRLLEIIVESREDKL